MRTYPSRPATSSLWTPLDHPPAGSSPVEQALVATVVRALSELLATPQAPAMVQTVNRELARQYLPYTVVRRPGAQRR